MFIFMAYFHCRTWDSDSDSDMDSCTMQDFSIGLDSDTPDPLIEIVCNRDGDLSLKNGYSNHLGKGSKS